MPLNSFPQYTSYVDYFLFLCQPFEGDFHEVLHDKGQLKARNKVRDWIISHT